MGGGRRDGMRGEGMGGGRERDGDEEGRWERGAGTYVSEWYEKW